MLFGNLLKILSTAMNCLTILKRLEKSVEELKSSQAKIERGLEAVGLKIATFDEVLAKILAAVVPAPAVGFAFTVELAGEITEGATNIEMTNSQQATATITPVDAKGNPAAVDGVPVWASSDETIITVEAAGDGLSAVVKAVGPLGSAKVSVTGDADLGTEVKPIFGSLDVTITQGQAVGFKVVLGEATEQ